MQQGQASNLQLLALQEQVQQENQRFTTVSNVMRAKHDTAKAAVSNLRLLNPDFEYMFFDDAQVEQFIDVEFPQYRSVFDSFTARIQRYDFFRYLALYRRLGMAA